MLWIYTVGLFTGASVALFVQYEQWLFVLLTVVMVVVRAALIHWKGV
jgi:hypothetical protein